jgi:hypothetical protein
MAAQSLAKACRRLASSTGGSRVASAARRGDRDRAQAGLPHLSHAPNTAANMSSKASTTTSARSAAKWNGHGSVRQPRWAISCFQTSQVSLGPLLIPPKRTDAAAARRQASTPSQFDLKTPAAKPAGARGRCRSNPTSRRHSHPLFATVPKAVPGDRFGQALSFSGSRTTPCPPRIPHPSPSGRNATATPTSALPRQGPPALLGGYSSLPNLGRTA